MIELDLTAAVHLPSQLKLSQVIRADGNGICGRSFLLRVIVGESSVAKNEKVPLLSSKRSGDDFQVRLLGRCFGSLKRRSLHNVTFVSWLHLLYLFNLSDILVDESRCELTDIPHPSGFLLLVVAADDQLPQLSILSIDDSICVLQPSCVGCILDRCLPQIDSPVESVLLLIGRSLGHNNHVGEQNQTSTPEGVTRRERNLKHRLAHELPIPLHQASSLQS